jgi:5-methyltetrahydropteroyltriglutamate--homocysteine methyltransferase
MNISKIRVAGLESCDVGSLPYTEDLPRLVKGADDFATNKTDGSADLFEKAIVGAFLDKLEAGILVPAFPQFRDMNSMFLSTFEGLEKIKGGWIETGRLTSKPGYNEIPEVAAIRRNAEKIYARIDSPFQLRVCITGPYTLSSLFPYRTSQTYRQLGEVLSEIVEKSTFSSKQGRVALIAIDEPLFGMVDEPLIDKGAEGRENLLAAWEAIAGKSKSHNAESCIHLHCTSDSLFWDVKSLGIVESHIDDPLYKMKVTKRYLEDQDKMLKASIAITDFDQLIRESLGSNAPDVALAEAWKKLSKGTLAPEGYLENVGVMTRRLVKIVEQFGVERIALAGPECGLWSFPTYPSAIECLKRVSESVSCTALSLRKS